MKSSFHHIQMNIDYKNSSFYKDLMKFIGWSVVYEGSDVVGFTNGSENDLWFFASKNKESSSYDGVGMNHLGIKVETIADVDKIVAFLKKKKVMPLFDTPRHRPEFAGAEDRTYYQVMFETPDKILFELVYSGPKQ